MLSIRECIRDCHGQGQPNRGRRTKDLCVDTIEGEADDVRGCPDRAREGPKASLAIRTDTRYPDANFAEIRTATPVFVSLYTGAIHLIPTRAATATVLGACQSLIPYALMAELRVNMGRSMAITRKPMIIPIITINKGSKSAVTAFTARSTSRS